MKPHKPGKDKKDEVVISVQPHIYSDTVFILVPPKFWEHKNLPECLKRAMEASQEKGQGKK